MVAILLGADNGFFYAGQIMHFSSPFTVFLIYHKQPYRDKTFRNTMAHYSLFGKISDAEIDEHVIGYGLFEKFFNAPFQTVNDTIIKDLKKTRDSLEQYVKI